MVMIAEVTMARVFQSVAPEPSVVALPSMWSSELVPAAEKRQ